MMRFTPAAVVARHSWDWDIQPPSPFAIVNAGSLLIWALTYLPHLSILLFVSAVICLSLNHLWLSASPSLHKDRQRQPSSRRLQRSSWASYKAVFRRCKTGESMQPSLRSTRALGTELGLCCGNICRRRLVQPCKKTRTLTEASIVSGDKHPGNHNFKTGLRALVTS